MLVINFSNVEELIFEDVAAQKLLPSMRNYFEQWNMSRMIPSLRSIGKSALLDLINELKDEHIDLLSSYFQDTVRVEKMNYSIVQNITIPIDSDVCDRICSLSDYQNISSYRDENNIYVTVWR